jgi:hypothetical protein
MEIHSFEGHNRRFSDDLVGSVQNYENRDVDVRNDKVCGWLFQRHFAFMWSARTCGFPRSFEEYRPSIEEDYNYTPCGQIRNETKVTYDEEAMDK